MVGVMTDPIIILFTVIGVGVGLVAWLIDAVRGR